jgi:hypothetical protein
MKNYINMSMFNYQLKLIRQRKEFFKNNEMFKIQLYLQNFLKKNNKIYKNKIYKNKIYFALPDTLLKLNQSNQNIKYNGRWYINKSKDHQYKYIDWANNDNSF